MSNELFSIELGNSAQSTAAFVGGQTRSKGISDIVGSQTEQGSKKTASLKNIQSLSNRLYQELLMAQVNNELEEVCRLAQLGVTKFPAEVRFHVALGKYYVAKKKFLEALQHLTQALSLEPQNSETLMAIGTALHSWDKPHDAKGFFQAACTVNPNNVVATSNLIHTSMAESDWSIFPKIDEMVEVIGKGGSQGNPFNLLSVMDKPELQKRLLIERDRLIQKNVVGTHRFEAKPSTNGKIRIGYFSSDFYGHATMFLMGKFFQMLDRDRFEVFLYEFGKPVPSDVTKEIREAADSFVNVASLTDKEVVDRARADGIDIAVDMKGYTNGCRPLIFSYRAAPIQVSYLGYPGTTGISTMDYFLADEVTVPEENRRFFNEKILYMPNCYQVNDNTRPYPEEVPSKADLGLPEDKFVFCSMNNPYKVTPVEYDIWMRLLHEVPDSVLWLMAPTQELQENLKSEAAARGIGAERLVFAGRVPTKMHLARLPRADLFLDTFNCCAHTTASETLWSGVPLVTRPGDQFASRVAASILTALDCEELIANSNEEYFELALKLAQDKVALNAVQQRVQDKLWTTPLYDSQGYVRDFEKLMELVMARFKSGKKPAHLSLN